MVRTLFAKYRGANQVQLHFRSVKAFIRHVLDASFILLSKIVISFKLLGFSSYFARICVKL